MNAIVEAGWFADPSERHDVRYWDGVRWTADVSDGGDQSSDAEVEAGWSPPGSARRLANRSLFVVCIGMPVATIVLVAWGLAIGTTSLGEGSQYGWGAFAKNLPVVVLVFALPILGLIWGVRAARTGARRNGTVAIWVASGGFFWALFLTGFGGLQAAYGDTPDWTGFPLLLLQVALTGGVLAIALAAARRGTGSKGATSSTNAG
jgi:hypothetical protein